MEPAVSRSAFATTVMAFRPMCCRESSSLISRRAPAAADLASPSAGNSSRVGADRFQSKAPPAEERVSRSVCAKLLGRARRRLRARQHPNRLDVHELAQTKRAELAPIARLLDASKRK